MKPAAGASILAAVLIVSLVWLSPACALADELPADTNQIESLAPEQAKKLAAEFPGVLVVIEGNIGTSFIERSLPLNGLKSLDAETAKAIAEFKGRVLNLSGLSTLDADIAKALAEFKGGGLYLNGLTTLNADAAKALAEFKGSTLTLNGLTALDADIAKTLAGFKGRKLELNGLTALDADAAKTLTGSTKWDGRLPKLTTLDAATAKAIAEFKDQVLYLNGLTTLDAATAKALVGFKGRRLELNGLTALDAATATALAELKRGWLQLDGLPTLDAETAKALAEFKGGWLKLNGLTTLDAATAKALTAFEGRLLVSAKVQEAFCDKNPLTPETALVWAKLLQGDLKRLTTLDAETAKALAEFKGEQLLLNGLTTLDAATAKALAGSPAWSGDLSSIVAIESPDSVEIAVALATKKGPLSLPNLTKISPKTLTALIEKEDVEIPLIETLELIQEPDGSPTDDFAIPKGFRTRQKRRQQGS